MVWVLALLVSDQIATFIFGGVSIMTLFQILPKVLFTLRLFGNVINPKILATLELIGFGTWFVWRVLMIHRWDLITLLAMIVLTGVSALVYYIDTAMYVYITKEDNR